VWADELVIQVEERERTRPIAVDRGCFFRRGQTRPGRDNAQRSASSIAFRSSASVDREALGALSSTSSPASPDESADSHFCPWHSDPLEVQGAMATPGPRANVQSTRIPLLSRSPTTLVAGRSYSSLLNIRSPRLNALVSGAGQDNLDLRSVRTGPGSLHLTSRGKGEDHERHGSPRNLAAPRARRFAPPAVALVVSTSLGAPPTSGTTLTVCPRGGGGVLHRQRRASGVHLLPEDEVLGAECTSFLPATGESNANRSVK
jgi:hypothetical protein